MNKRKSDVILRKRQKQVVDSLSDETLELWKLAQAKKLWLTGEPIKIEGQEVDFSHFDFTMAIAKFSKMDMTSDLKMIQRFWITLYPYIENLVYNVNRYEQQFKDLAQLEGQTLKSYALQNLELQCYQKFFKEELHKYTENAHNIKEAFKVFHEAWEEESQAKIAEIKKQEEEHIKRQEEAAKKHEELQRQEALRAKLSVNYVE